jgi:hypothetical protein
MVLFYELTIRSFFIEIYLLHEALQMVIFCIKGGNLSFVICASVQ